MDEDDRFVFNLIYTELDHVRIGEIDLREFFARSQTIREDYGYNLNMEKT